MIAAEITTDPLQLIQTGGLIGALIVAVWGAHKGWWVPRWMYLALLKDRDEWKNIALKTAGVLEASVDVTKETTEKLRHGKGDG